MQEEFVSVEHSGTLHGSLSLPAGKVRLTLGPMPIAVMVAGSGPTDRDGNSATLPGKSDCLRLLAQGLAQHGLASLRFDKRGVGPSRLASPPEVQLRLETFVDDLILWVETLRSDKRFGSIVLLGHSEGALLSILAASKVPVAGLICMCGSALPGGQLYRSQLKRRLPEQLFFQADAILTRLEKGEMQVPCPPELLSLFRPSVQPYLVSWFKHDALKVAAGLSVPSLFVQGSSDLQVFVDDANQFKAVAPKSQAITIAGMNHVLKYANGGIEQQMPTYTDPSIPLHRDVVPSIKGFLQSLNLLPRSQEVN